MNTLVRLSAATPVALLLASLLCPRVGAAQPAPPAPPPAPAPESPPAPPAPPPTDDAAQPPGPPAPPPTDGAAQPAPPAPPPDPTPARGAEWTSLRLLREKGVISEAEYTSALKDMGEVVGAADANTLVLSKIKVSLYGFVEVNFVHNSTQSCQEFCSNFLVQKPGTYRGDHGRTIFSVRDSRFGLRLAAPEAPNGIRASGLIETDFFGPTTTSEQGTWVNPVLRVRHAFLKLETPIVDLLIGQTWNLFGWQANYLVTSVQEPGLPGQMFQRTAQLRVSKTLKMGDVSLELALAALRPPQMDSGTPEGAGGVRLVLGSWTGLHTLYMTSTAIQPASIGVSADLRRFRIAELSPTPRRANTRIGGGVAFDAYLPIVRATKDKRDHALSVVGELTIGRGTSDMYTALGAAGTSNAPIPPVNPGDPPGTYAANFDPGFAAYDADGNLELIKWTSYMVGAEYYPPGFDGHLGLFANYGHMQSANSGRFGGAAVMDPALGRTRESEDFYNAGLFFDPTAATRVGVDTALYHDHYVDGTSAKNYSVMSSVFLFF
jgi:hypothetical protein